MNRLSVWKALQNETMEYCDVDITEADVRIDGKIVGMAEDIPVSVTYDIMTDSQWQITSLEVLIEKESQPVWISLQREPGENWTQSGHERPEWKDCIDIDISLTPFTNTLPIRRLDLQPGERREISVLYIDICKGSIEPAQQWYTRLSDTQYGFENADGFKAVINVDEEGLVTEYEALFIKLNP